MIVDIKFIDSFFSCIIKNPKIHEPPLFLDEMTSWVYEGPFFRAERF